jgi:hypothetical protein
MSSEHTSPEHTSPAHASPDAPASQITSEQAKAAQEQLIAQEQRAAQNPEAAAMQEQRAGMEQQFVAPASANHPAEKPMIDAQQQAAIEAQKQRVAQLVAGREQVAQQLQTPESSALPAVVISAGTALGVGKVVQVLGDAKGKAQDAVVKLIKEQEPSKVLDPLLKQAEKVEGVNVEGIKETVTGAIGNIKQFATKTQIAETIKGWFTEETSQLGAYAGKAGKFAELAEKVDVTKTVGEGSDKYLAELSKKIERVIGTKNVADPSHIEWIKESVVKAAEGKQGLVEGVEKDLAEGIKQGMQNGNIFSKTANSAVNAWDSIPIPHNAKVAIVVVGSIVAGKLVHDALTADERKQREASKEIYGQFTAEIAQQQQRLAEMAVSGQKGGRQ